MDNAKRFDEDEMNDYDEYCKHMLQGYIDVLKEGGYSFETEETDKLKMLTSSGLCSDDVQKECEEELLSRESASQADSLMEKHGVSKGRQRQAL